MKFEFIFSNLPDIKAKTTAKIKTSLQLPDEIVHLISVEERIREIGKQVGMLTQASLHISCKDLGIKDELMNEVEFEYSSFHFTTMKDVLALAFSDYRGKKAALYICQPYHPQKIGLPHSLINYHKGKGRKTLSLLNNVRLLSTRWISTTDQQNYHDAIQIISQQLSVLLNADPNKEWSFRGFHPFWTDEPVRKSAKKERKRILKHKSDSAQNKNADKHGKGNRIGAIPGKFMGVQFRSQLEIRLATDLEQRGIEWIYEEERLGEGNYLVDFHLPQNKAWVEVKGRFEARDHFLLKEVAEVLEKRGEKLYVFTSGKPKIVTPDEFTPIPRKEFWSLIENLPDKD